MTYGGCVIVPAAPRRGLLQPAPCRSGRDPPGWAPFLEVRGAPVGCRALQRLKAGQHWRFGSSGCILVLQCCAELRAQGSLCALVLQLKCMLGVAYAWLSGFCTTAEAPELLSALKLVVLLSWPGFIRLSMVSIMLCMSKLAGAVRRHEAEANPAPAPNDHVQAAGAWGHAASAEGHCSCHYTGLWRLTGA